MTTIGEIQNCNLVDILLWIVRRRRRFRVAGRSMWPLLEPGEEVFIDPNAYRRRSPQPGEIVTLFHPQRGDLKIIKRVVCVDAEGRCFVCGDNPLESTDSRQFGWVDSDRLIGRVVCRFGDRPSSQRP
jgi:nickel-type superoxide dismutase maturation protease